MAVKNQYQDLLRSKVVSAISQANAAAGFSHQGVKGTVLELLVSQLFTPLLPADVGVGTGQIIDSYSGKLSGQIDIILYNKAILPPILMDEKVGIFPIESVLYTIEVKTTLNATELKMAHDSAKNLAQNFSYRPGLKGEDGKEKHHTIEKVRSVVFALHSDLSGNKLNEAERYRKLYGEDAAHIRAICVAGKEYWYDNGNYWIGFKDGQDFDEILAFIGGVTNTYREVSTSRGQPCLGHYVIPEARGFITTKSKNVPSVALTCENCGIEGKMTPNIGPMDITINGAISSKEPCPNCEGKMSSKNGTYVFKNGKLVDSKLG
ncbi:hypothetical protein GNX18_01500 [Microbulbifer sp. SH-1]|uniref:DUF6602 domain-containing protein n=1 Tax=Microbulbifer sp. SH-1 TaxID=2681547 RepID=UPI00140917F5|nr:DUF6602 domain-containing protein [Microbulbifer sp. SH-1]QIL88590.1 hypothetical protein GNX18_01500 [Microbulbifer sp. SH-1]